MCVLACLLAAERYATVKHNGALLRSSPSPTQCANVTKVIIFCLRSEMNTHIYSWILLKTAQRHGPMLTTPVVTMRICTMLCMSRKGPRWVPMSQKGSLYVTKGTHVPLCHMPYACPRSYMFPQPRYNPLVYP